MLRAFLPFGKEGSIAGIVVEEKGVAMNIVTVTKVETEIVYMFGEKCVVVTYHYSDGTTREVTRRCA